MIPFNKPTITGKESEYLQKLVNNPEMLGGRFYSTECEAWINKYYENSSIFLNNSGTQALEFAAFLLNIQPGDEVIMPSYTFVATASAVALRGGTPVFVDIRPDTMNIDENLIESAITDKTVAIIVVHYAGLACEMEKIKIIAGKHQLTLVEDNAQSFMAKYNGQLLGTFGDIATISFNFTKNINCGEGGGTIINNKKFVEKAEIIYEIGTNKQQFFRGEAEAYTWKELGSKFYPNQITAAFLYAQLLEYSTIAEVRMNLWNRYYQSLNDLGVKGCIELSVIPKHCEHNAHIFYIKLADKQQRDSLITFLKKREIATAFHYLPLHKSDYGKKIGRFIGNNDFATSESEKLLRLPLYHTLTEQEQLRIIYSIEEFFK